MAYSACDLFQRCLARRHGEDWRLFVDRHGVRVRRISRSALRQRVPRSTAQDAEELLQDLYCRLLSAHGFRGSSDAEFWTYVERMARNLALDRQRGKMRRHRAFEKEAIDSRKWCVEHGYLPLMRAPESSPEQRLLSREEMRGFFDRCRRATSGTPVKMQVALRAFLRGESSCEISRALDGRMTPDQIDAMLFRLRRRLAKQGVELPKRQRSAVVAI